MIEVVCMKPTDACMVCYDAFKNDQSAVVMQCGNPEHYFCSDCWHRNTLLVGNDRCPMCRVDGIGIEAKVLICYSGKTAEEAIPVD